MTTTKTLGPESLTWRYFGDLRTSMLGMWVVALQNMYPDLGTAVEEHSVMTAEPLRRVMRSMYQIMGVVYDGDRACETARQVRNYHRPITGEMLPGWGGRRYHALDPDTFYWAHVTFFMQTLLTADRFCGGLSEEQKRQLFDEHIIWYRTYGLSMRPVPETWEDFQVYWDHKCRDELEINQATVDILNMCIPKPSALPIPTRWWNRVTAPFIAGGRWIATGLFDPVVRERAGLRWASVDETLLHYFCEAVNLGFRLVPNRIRLHPRAYSAFRRPVGDTSAPLVQAPAYMGISVKGHEGLPQHYRAGGYSPSFPTVAIPQIIAGIMFGTAAVCCGTAWLIYSVRRLSSHRWKRNSWHMAVR